MKDLMRSEDHSYKETLLNEINNKDQEIIKFLHF